MQRHQKLNDSRRIPISLRNFIEETRNQNRFFYSDKSITLLKQIVQQSELDRLIVRGTIFFRARIGHQVIEPSDYLTEEQITQLDPDSPAFDNSLNIVALDETDMMPPPNRITITGGRLNPSHIPYVYTAESIETACAEVRPYLEETISIARITNKEDLLIKDMTLYKNIENPWDQILFDSVDRLFAKPLSPSESNIDYIPTQVIAEYLKKQGYNGVCYKSSLHEGGKNVLFFNMNQLKWIEGHKVMETKRIQYQFVEIQSASIHY